MILVAKFSQKLLTNPWAYSNFQLINNTAIPIHISTAEVLAGHRRAGVG